MDLFSMNPAVYVDGYFVDQRWVTLQQLLEMYSASNGITPAIELRWIPPNMRAAEDASKAYAVVGSKYGQEYVICYADEKAQPEEVLTEVFMSDINKHDIMERMEARAAAIEAFKLKRQQEEREERMELAAWMMRQQGPYKMRDKHGQVVRRDEWGRKLPGRTLIT